MSSLIFFLSRQEAIIATDALVVDLRFRQPLRHCSKAVHIPHVNTIFASTGVAGLMNDWCFFVNDRIATADVDTLSTSAPEFLRETFKGYKENGIQDDLTVTIYHFGISITDNVIKAYAHRSENGFVGERIECGLGMKPFAPLPEEEYFPEDIVLPLMKNQVLAQEQVPENTRIYIGGQVLVHHLTLDERCCTYCVGEL